MPVQYNPYRNDFGRIIPVDKADLYHAHKHNLLAQQNAAHHNQIAMQQAQNPENHYWTTSTSSHITPYETTIENIVQRKIQEETHKIKVEFDKAKAASIAQATLSIPSDHIHFMIHGMHENYCLCGLKVPK